MTIGRDNLAKAEIVTVAAIENDAPLLAEACKIIVVLQSTIGGKCAAELNPWLDRASKTLVASFAWGVLKDRAAVAAAISLL